MPDHKYILGRELDGRFSLNALTPVRAPLIPSGEENLFLQAGEPIGLRHWCPDGVALAFGVDLNGFKPLHVVEVKIDAEVIGEPILAPTLEEVEKLKAHGIRHLMRLAALREMRQKVG